MKKALSIAVSAAMLFSLSACGSNETIAETPIPDGDGASGFR